jgi:Skp family chaperone for outer membrane proteins
LLTLAGTLNEEFGKARVSAQAVLSQEQVALVQKFRDEVFPVAKEIAQERGFKTILLKSESVLFAWEPESEITEEVIKRMSTPLVP